MQDHTTEVRNAGTTPDAVLDPVDYAVISQALVAIAREMGTKLIRSSYSNIVREAQDASAALFDAQGNVVAQAELIPMHLGSMSEIFLACVAQCPIDRLQPGDFYINNDPYGGGQHLQDVFIFTPIFVARQIIAFAGTVAHHLDLGGGNPGTAGQNGTSGRGDSRSLCDTRHQDLPETKKAAAICRGFDAVSNGPGQE